MTTGIIIGIVLVILVILFMGSWLLINAKCLFKRETSWEKITHNRTIRIEDVTENQREVEKV